MVVLHNRLRAQGALACCGTYTRSCCGRDVIDVSIELERLDQGGLAAQGGSQVVGVPLRNTGTSRVSCARGRQVVIMGRSLDRHFTPEVIDPAVDAVRL